ncbi:MAG: hypothetical protein WEA54_02585 [Actinomycetota bacterium]
MREAATAFRLTGFHHVQRLQLERSGVEILQDTQLDGNERIYVRDPFGNRLELIEERE